MRKALLIFAMMGAAGCGSVKANNNNNNTDPDAGDTTQCTDNTDCGGTTPIGDLEALLCVACTANTECEFAGAAGSYCGTTGACVECLEDDHCEVAAPVCGADQSCRGCTSNDECPSGACNFESGACEAEANVVYVGGDGAADAGTCTRSFPCATIAYGFGQLQDVNRNTIVLAPGTYNDWIPSQGDDYRLIGYGAIIDGTGLNGTLQDGLVRTPFGRSVTIEGIEVINSPNQGIYCSGGDVAMPTLTLRDVTVSGSVDSAITNQKYNVISQICNMVLVGITVRGSGDTAIALNKGRLEIDRSRLIGNPGSVLSGNETSVLIQNTLIANNGSNNYNRTLRFDGTDPGSSIVFRYNTVVFNAPGCVPTLQFLTTQEVIIDSNIVWGNQVECSGNIDFSQEHSLTNNIIEMVNEYETIPPGNFIADPDMSDPQGGNYSLKPGSVGVDKGTVAGAPPYDHNGDPRPLGLGPDIGAFESL